MSTDKDKNVLEFGNLKATIEVRPHPEEVIDVDPQVIALMEARLTGQSFTGIFGDEDKVSNEFLIRKEIEKLKRIFGDAKSVAQRYLSIKAIKEVSEELRFEEVETDFLARYALKKAGGQFVDQVDLFTFLVGNVDLITKQQRFDAQLAALEQKPESKLLTSLGNQYLKENFQVLRMTKEIIQLELYLKSLVQADRAAFAMNDLLHNFYGVNP